MKNLAQQRIEQQRTRAAVAVKWRGRLKRLGLSLSEFCRLRNFHVSLTWKWFNGDKLPDESTVKKVERALAREEERVLRAADALRAAQ